MTIELRFEDGTTERREWDGQERWARVTVVRPSKLEAAVVDPDDVLALDSDRLNDSRLVEPRQLPAAKFLTDVLFWFQGLFGAGGFFA